MTAISKSVFVMLLLETLLIMFFSFTSYAGCALTYSQLFFMIIVTLVTMLFMLYAKGFYQIRRNSFKDFYYIFEAVTVATVLELIIFAISINADLLAVTLTVINSIFIFISICSVRFLNYIRVKFLRKNKNVLIVGAGKDGRFIAEEIQARPELGFNVVGFLDDNMNTIEDENSDLPILGLTCDSEAVIKDNNVKIVVVAVKSRMDSVILTDLIKGIPLGVKVWRMAKFYEKIANKYFVSKMTVNWLFYSCVKKEALISIYIKRIFDIIFSLFVLLVTLPISVLTAIIVKLSDLGPVFFYQTRIGKYGKPFKMIKFRTMYQEKIEENFDDDVDEIFADDKRIMPLCRIIRKFRIDELPQMLNVLRGDMSIVGPRAVREEVYKENKEYIPYWECRNWVRPGWCGWHLINTDDISPEEILSYDLYYIKHRTFLMELSIILQFIIKNLSGKRQ